MRLDDPDAVARLLYLVVLLAGLLAVSLGRRPWRLGQRLRHLGVWMVILALLVIGYGYRDSLRAGFFPAAPVSVGQGVIELRRGLDGHFSADLRINGETVRVMVDTGASDLVLSRRDAARAGIDVDALAFTGRAITANGAVATAPVRLASVEFGDLRDTNVRASVTDGGLDSSLLGMGYLDRFARIEIEGDRMRLTR